MQIASTGQVKQGYTPRVGSHHINSPSNKGEDHRDSRTRNKCIPLSLARRCYDKGSPRLRVFPLIQWLTVGTLGAVLVLSMFPTNSVAQSVGANQGDQEFAAAVLHNRACNGGRVESCNNLAAMVLQGGPGVRQDVALVACNG